MLLGIVVVVINIIGIVGGAIGIYYLIQFSREIRENEKVLKEYKQKQL